MVSALEPSGGTPAQGAINPSATDRITLIAGNLLFVLALFPFFKILPNVAAEVQPIGGIIGLGVLALGWRRRGVGRALAPLFAVIAVYGAVCLLQFAVDAPPGGINSAVEAFAVLVAPLCLVLGLGTVVEGVSARIVVLCACGSALLGTLQLLAPSTLAATGISTILSAAIPRLAIASQATGGRGVTMLAPEPSYAAPTILLLLIASLWLHANGRMGRTALVLMLALVGWMVILNSSVTLVVSILVFAIVYSIAAARHQWIWTIPAVAVVLLALWALPSFATSDVRPLRVAGEIATLASTGQASLTDLVAISDANGSVRLRSVIEGYLGASSNFGAGLGLNAWQDWLSGYLTDAELLATSPKPFAYGAFVAMTMGLPGLIALAAALWTIIVKSALRRPAGLVAATVVTALVGILANSPVSLPAYWAMLLFILSRGQMTNAAVRVHNPRSDAV